MKSSFPSARSVAAAVEGRFSGTVSMIVGFELSIASLTGKWKLSQNHPTPNRRGVVKGLRDAAGEESRQVADMLSSLEERPDGPHD